MSRVSSRRCPNAELAHIPVAFFAPRAPTAQSPALIEKYLPARPLHTISDADLGGNCKLLEPAIRKAKNLHSLWNGEIVNGIDLNDNLSPRIWRTGLRRSPLHGNRNSRAAIKMIGFGNRTSSRKRIFTRNCERPAKSPGPAGSHHRSTACP